MCESNKTNSGSGLTIMQKILFLKNRFFSCRDYGSVKVGRDCNHCLVYEDCANYCMSKFKVNKFRKA